ncbi:MAG: ECF transporter S component [Clostridiales bacterium]|nr:ECF transporter S component [Clostridiales bacterium]
MNTRKTNWRFWLSLAIMVLLVPLAVVLFTRLKQSFYLSGLTIIVLTIAAFFLHFESRKPQARELVLLAVLCALAVASRAAFGFVPHFKPMLAIVMLTGIAFGPEAGFLCGAISGFASNFIFGQGPWTPWQMFAYGIGGMLAGLFALCGILKKSPRAWRDGGWRDILGLTVFGFLCILLVVGPLLDTSTFFMAGFSASSPLAVYLAGVPVNCVHGSAVALTMLLFGKPLLDRLRRIQIKYGMMEP